MKHRIINEIFDWDSSRFSANGLLSALRLQTTKHSLLWFFAFLFGNCWFTAFFAGIVCLLVFCVYVSRCRCILVNTYAIQMQINGLYVHRIHKLCGESAFTFSPLDDLKDHSTKQFPVIFVDLFDFQFTQSTSWQFIIQIRVKSNVLFTLKSVRWEISEIGAGKVRMANVPISQLRAIHFFL